MYIPQIDLGYRGLQIRVILCLGSICGIEGGREKAHSIPQIDPWYKGKDGLLTLYLGIFSPIGGIRVPRTSHLRSKHSKKAA